MPAQTQVDSSMPDLDESTSPLTDAQKAHVVDCLAARGLITPPDSIAAVECRGTAIVFTDRRVLTVLPDTGRAIREGL